MNAHEKKVELEQSVYQKEAYRIKYLQGRRLQETYAC